MATTTDIRDQLYQGRRRSLWSVHWTFDDGMAIYMTEDHSDRWAERKARIYMSSTLPFNLLEDLANRWNRPYEMWRSHAVDAMDRIGLEGRMSWSQRAGCSCGCSPGFIFHAPMTHGVEFFVRVPDLALQ